MSARRDTAASDLREEFERLEEAEEKARSEDEKYTFSDLREDVNPKVADGIASSAINIDDEEEQMYILEDAFDTAYEWEGLEAGYADRPLKMETGVLLGSIAGLGGSAYQFWKSGDPFYLGTGALSAGFGVSTFRRMARTLGARGDSGIVDERLDEEFGDKEDYEITVFDRDEAKEHVRENTGFAVYEREELEEMDGKELKEELERDVYS
jgi:hypothetical protein